MVRMVKGRKTKLIETLYKGEILNFAYEVYLGSDVYPHIRTYVILNDGFNTKIKLEELGQYKEELIEELKLNGFIDITKNQSLLLKKTA